MKTYIALLLTLGLLLSLAACGGGETPAGTTAPGQSAADPGKQITESTESTETQPQELQDTPFGEYLSEGMHINEKGREKIADHFVYKAILDNYAEYDASSMAVK